MNPHDTSFKLAFIGAGNMASALAAGLIGKRCGGSDVLAIDIYPPALESWAQQGVQTAYEPGPALSKQRIWVFAVKPQVMKETVLACKPYLQEDTLVISVAAGIPATALADWLGEPGKPYQRVIRCMPNTPALVSQGVSGLYATAEVSAEQRDQAQELLSAVGLALSAKKRG